MIWVDKLLSSAQSAIIFFESLTLNDFSLLAQIVGTFLVAAGLVFTGQQLREIRQQVKEDIRSRKLKETQIFLSQIGVDEVRAIRRWLLTNNFQTLDATSILEDDRAKVLRLAVAYDRVGLMTSFDLLDLDFISEWQGVEICQLWDIVKEIIESERILPGRSQYCRYFEELSIKLRNTQANGSL
jgi:hypothetical protein